MPYQVYEPIVSRVITRPGSVVLQMGKEIRYAEMAYRILRCDNALASPRGVPYRALVEVL